jgi:hypothetical protein
MIADNPRLRRTETQVVRPSPLSSAHGGVQGDRFQSRRARGRKADLPVQGSGGVIGYNKKDSPRNESVNERVIKWNARLGDRRIPWRAIDGV